MSSSTGKPPTRRRWTYLLFNTIACLAIVGASVMAVVIINKTEPKAQRIENKRKSAALVGTVTAKRGTYSPQLVMLGTVQPAQDIVLSPRVRGQVIELSPEFVPGGMVRKDDLLLQIDPADFKNAVSIRKSELKQARASLEIEDGRQSLAKKELALMKDAIDESNRALVLRKPQYVSISSQVSAAEAAVERAELDLERTRVVAPFDAQILRRSANVGSQVGPGDELGQLVGIDEYWVMAAVPVRSLRWIQFPDPDSDVLGSEVTLSNSDAWGVGQVRHGRVSRMIGTVDQRTRLARVLVTVPDPLALELDAPPLILETLIETRIEGRPIENVVRVERKYLHERDTVWVMKNNKLEIRETEIAFRDAEHAYILKGVEDGEEIVTTTLATVADGVGLRRVSEATEESTTSEASAAEGSE